MVSFTPPPPPSVNSQVTLMSVAMVRVNPGK
jgi:hypothetical protein